MAEPVTAPAQEEVGVPDKYTYTYLPKHTKLPPNLMRLPCVRQATDYTCGVSCLQSILAYWGHEFREDRLAKHLKAEGVHGTGQAEIIEFAKKLGYEAEMFMGFTVDKLKKCIDEKSPTIVLFQAWADETDGKTWKDRWGDGHYAVAIGYDEERFYFMDPSTLGMRTYLPIQEFDDRWHNKEDGIVEDHCAVVIRRPNEAPTYDEGAFIHID